MSDYLEKARLEQEKKRELWRQQQKARMAQNLEEKSSFSKGNDEEEKGEAKKDVEEEMEQGREVSFASALARVREAKRKETAQKKKISQGESVGGKIKESQKSLKDLKNIYRIINGASAVTVVGIIITFLVMNTQLVFGNIFKIGRIPPLSFSEIMIVLLVDFILFLAIVILLVFIIAIVGIILEQPFVKFLIDIFNISIS
jgi:hypothetical protein